MKNKLILGLITFLSLPISALALNATPTLSCDNLNLSVGASTNCTITVNVTSGSISSFSGLVSLSGDLQLVSVNNSSIWQGNGTGGNYQLYTDNLKNGNVAIGSFVVKVKSSSLNDNFISLTNISIGDENFNEVKQNNLKNNVKIALPLSSVNTLNSLSLSSGKIDFKSDTLTYNISVGNVNKIKIDSELTDSKSSYVSGYGNREVNLNYGVNNIAIKVKAENGDIKTYTLNITRDDPRSKVNTLKTLSLSDCKIDFKSNNVIYNLTVDEKIEKVVINSTLTDSKSSYVAGYGNRTVNLNKGKNSILIKVQAENGDVLTYTLNVTRGKAEESNIDQNLKSNADIKELKIKNHDIDFSFDKYLYDVDLLTDENNLEFEIVLKNDKANFEIIGNENLENSSIITIKVTSEDKTVTNEYKINILKNNSDVEEADDEPTEDEPGKENPNTGAFIGIGIATIGVAGIGAVCYSSKKKILK